MISLKGLSSVMYCKDCEYRNPENHCHCPKICEDWEHDGGDDSLIYSYCESGWFKVGDYFGCVHFKKEE